MNRNSRVVFEQLFKSEMTKVNYTVISLLFLCIICVRGTNVTNSADVNSIADGGQSLYNGLDNDTAPPWTEPRKYEIRDSADRLMWFLQITDLHISIFNDPSRITEFQEFCNSTVSAFAPYVVIASGDLTDSKTEDGAGVREILPEWKHYKTVLDGTEITKKTIWLDLRGNHDTFNVLNVNSMENHFTNFSIQGKKHPRSYMHQISAGGEKYTFVAIDACLQPGPKFPLNFVGALDVGDIEKIHRLVAQSRQSKSDYIFWFGHYPTSCIIAQYDGGARNLIGKYGESMVYMCGHYHTLEGLVPNMYALHGAGYLELELADWKNSRTYRLAAIDHGQFSFIDIKHQEWPVVLVTNPKHALYMMPKKENPQSIIESTHIRVLAFSLVRIKSVEIKIDDGSWQNCYNVKGPLYVVKWNPLAYASGIHHITARVVDDEAREKEILQPFILGDTRLSLGALPRFFLTSDASTIFRIIFGSVLAILIIPLCILRFLHALCERNKMKRPRLLMPVCGWWTRKLWVLSTVDSLFFPLIIYPLYLTFGPWSVGEIVDDQIGVVFAWGIYIGSSYLPGCVTYLYGALQLFSFQLPLVLILAHRVERRLKEIDKPLQRPSTVLRLLWRHLPFLLIVGLQSAMIYFFWRAYGALAGILCPLKTGSLILAAFLWYRANTMPQECLRPAARVWLSSERLASRDPDENQRSPSS